MSLPIRRPMSGRELYESEEPKFTVSPDSAYKVASYHFIEERMGFYRGLFCLLRDDDIIIDTFEPLTTYGDKCIFWKPDSKMFVIGVADFGFGFLFVTVPERQIAFVKIRKPHSINIHFENDVCVFSHDEYNISLLNSTETFGGGKLEIPSKHYIKPEDVHVSMGNVKFVDREVVNDADLFTELNAEIKLDPIDRGFKPFSGRLPQHTEEIYNHRQFEVYQLMAFAEYGDLQSQHWLSEINDFTNSQYNVWEKVSYYLGHKERKP